VRRAAVARVVLRSYRSLRRVGLQWPFGTAAIVFNFLLFLGPECRPGTAVRWCKTVYICVWRRRR
jgi:hypothetical protein